MEDNRGRNWEFVRRYQDESIIKEYFRTKKVHKPDVVQDVIKRCIKYGTFKSFLIAKEYLFVHYSGEMHGRYLKATKDIVLRIFHGQNYGVLKHITIDGEIVIDTLMKMAVIHNLEEVLTMARKWFRIAPAWMNKKSIDFAIKYGMIDILRTVYRKEKRMLYYLERFKCNDESYQWAYNARIPNENEVRMENEKYVPAFHNVKYFIKDNQIIEFFNVDLGQPFVYVY